ncbi:MAG: histidine--tRNA ligase [Desulfovibrio sp.]|nr:histidine--tRNA ligase [Desulfovibrio sp.]
MSIAKIKGFSDLFSPESDTFTAIESLARTLFSQYGFTELRTPILEYTELFARSIGEETDVVHKEMYTLTTEKGRSYSLRPEATAGVMRAYIEGALYTKMPVARLFTTGPMFRHERPQKGRLRQFHQINCECLGSESPYADADMITMLMRFLTSLELGSLELALNSLGCSECRPRFKHALTDYLNNLPKDAFCEDCQRRIHTNPLRVLDCKQEQCQNNLTNAPTLADALCPACKEHFALVCSLLQSQGIHYVLAPRLVRGLDYYTRTTFEVQSAGIGSQSAIAGGGRYDGLIKALGGPDVPGIGFACGIERLALLLQNRPSKHPDFFLAVLDEANLPQGFTLLQSLRSHNLSGTMNFQGQSFKSLLRQADKTQATYCLILGSNEIQDHTITVKTMSDGTQTTVAQDALYAHLSAGNNHE